MRRTMEIVVMLLKTVVSFVEFYIVFLFFLLWSLAGARRGLPAQPVRCCGCRRVSGPVHDGFPHFSIHGDVPGMVEVESLGFQIFLHMLHPRFPRGTSLDFPRSWSLPPEDGVG